MRKYYIIPFLCLTSLLFSACFEDKGNYDYKPAEGMLPIEILGFENAEYGILSKVHIAPTVKGIVNEDDYEYIWYSFPATGATIYKDTLAHTKELDFVISFPLNQPQTVVYKITDKKTGIYKLASASITAVSAISKGWFVMKDESDMTDIDIILPSGEILNNALSKAIGSKMEGKPVKMLFHSAYYYMNESGALKSDKQIYHLMSDRDFKTVDAGDFKIMKNFEDQFYSEEFPAPGDIRGADNFGRQAAVIIINNGKAHCYMGQAAHASVFEYAKLGSANLYPAVVASIFSSITAVVFDMATKSYFYVYGTDIRLIEPPVVEGKLSPVKMDADMIWMDQVEDGATSSANGWSIMKTSDGKYLLIDLTVTSTAAHPFAMVTELDPARKILTASVREPFQGGMAKAIFFAHGNVLSYYLRQGDDSPTSEKDIYTFPAGETVSHISHIYVYAPYKNHLAVTTNKDGQWKLYVFEMKEYNPALSPDIVTTSPQVFTGSGNAHWVLDRN